DEIRPLEPSCRAGESADREPVPPRENLLVATRPHAPLARFEELPPRAGEELRRIGLAERVDGLDDLEMPCLAAAVRILEVRLAVKAEDALRDLRLVGGEHAVDFLACEHVEAAFAARGVRVERRVEPAARIVHLADQKACGLCC